MSIVGVRLEELFDRDRFETGWDEFSLVFYFPFGLCLVIVRIIISLLLFIIANILPRLSTVRCITLRILYTILGIIIKEEGVHFRDPKATILISNHVTVFDHIAIDLISPCVLSVTWELPQFLQYVLGFKKHERSGEYLDSSHRKDSKNSVLIFPEGATTNGQRGLLKFVNWPISSNEYIQPIILKVYRPAGVNISPSIIGSSWYSDLFWMFFVPFTWFDIKYLPVMIRKDEQFSEEFSLSVQTIMAQELNVIPTSYTVNDKNDYAKRLLTAQIIPQQSNVSSRTVHTYPNTNLNIMSQQVKEVLPYVPINVIEQDLAVTGSISLTINRILEGNVLYIPEPEITGESKPTQSTASQSSKNNLSSQFPSVAPKTFGKTPEERMMSYQERKRLLISNARRRYLQKHAAI
ncbi:lipid droplet-regulating VLDL assembly factor AUP1-like [Centruroides vittatus]|uniref:lipid droplet-regulating VLDL assembly factor AUP1-like n=1 Tax=Centruroides vittatus TaxID=120091 RepID=UPI00350EF0B5